MAALNATHDATRRSWVETANAPDTDFPIQNLPFGVFRVGGGAPRGGAAIGDRILDLAAVLEAGLLSGPAEAAARAAAGPALNPLMALGNGAASALRTALSDLLDAEGGGRSRVEAMRDRLLVPMADATMELPASIGSFTDFLCSIDHTLRMSRTGELPPAFKSLPIAYHSRATSVRVSGADVVRPNGQFRKPDGTLAFGPEPAQDYELELGIVVGPGNALGQPFPIEDADERIFGFCLLNDWSARLIQGFESTPLGPFLSKSLSTTISPWVVTAEAMAPFRVPARPRDAADAPPPHLTGAEDQAEGGLDLAMEVRLTTGRMREAGGAPVRITDTNFSHCYWTVAQMLTHHASNGCNMQPGDLFGSGTISGPTDDSRACLAELTARGSEPLELPNGETRAFLEDGDEVVFRARASRDGYVPIGFGECRGRIAPAVKWPGAS